MFKRLALFVMNVLVMTIVTILAIDDVGFGKGGYGPCSFSVSSTEW